MQLDGQRIDQSIADGAVDRRLEQSAGFTMAKRHGGRVNLSDLISTRRGERQAKAEARATIRKDRKAQAEMEDAFAAVLSDDLKGSL